VRSRSARNVGFVGARGARCSVAKARAVEIEAGGSAGVEAAGADFVVEVLGMVQARISSMSWRRSREKCKAVSVSSSWGTVN
jgi:hypothetical protein